MSKKRDFTEIGSPDPEERVTAPHVHNDRQHMIKKQKSNEKPSGKSKHRPNEGSSEWSKKRARTIDRLLKRNQDLPANVRNDLERELAALKTTVSDKAHQKKRSAMISKYHMVRFFERKKAMRLAKSLRRQIEKSESPEEIEELKRDLHVAEVDEAYSQHFPHAEPYISLYTSTKSKTEKDEEGDDEDDKIAAAKALLRSARPPIWSNVEQAMKDGPNALRSLRERRPQVNSQAEKRPARKQQKPKANPNTVQLAAKKPQQQETSRKTAPSSKDQNQAGLNRRERRRLMRETMQPAEKSEDEDDGEGFFEED